MMPSWFFDHLQLFLVLPFFDQVPNKGSAILNPCQSWTKMEESRLWGSYLCWVHCKSPNLLQPSLVWTRSAKQKTWLRAYFLNIYTVRWRDKYLQIILPNLKDFGHLMLSSKYNAQPDDTNINWYDGTNNILTWIIWINYVFRNANTQNKSCKNSEFLCEFLKNSDRWNQMVSKFFSTFSGILWKIFNFGNYTRVQNVWSGSKSVVTFVTLVNQ